MAKLTKRTVDTTEIRFADYVIWDEELPGFGLRLRLGEAKLRRAIPCRRPVAPLRDRTAWRLGSRGSQARGQGPAWPGRMRLRRAC